MGNHTSLLSVTAVAVAMLAGVGAQQAPVASPQTFRVGTDLVVLDVSVLDKDRHPVRGLTTADFTVLVDEKPRPVVAFKAVDVAPPAPPEPTAPAGASWLRDVAPDVATNDHPPGRVVAILIDNYTIAEARLDASQIQTARQTALAVIDTLGPDDRAAVLFTDDRHSAQTFTTDRKGWSARRHQSCRHRSGPSPDSRHGSPAERPVRVRTLRDTAIGNVSHALASLSEQRKTIFYVGAGSLLIAPMDRYEQPTDPVIVCRRRRLEVAPRRSGRRSYRMSSSRPSIRRAGRGLVRLGARHQSGRGPARFL